MSEYPAGCMVFGTPETKFRKPEGEPKGDQTKSFARWEFENHLGLDIRLSLIVEPNSKSYIEEDSHIECSMHNIKWTSGNFHFENPKGARGNHGHGGH